MRKEIEIVGCLDVPIDTDVEEFTSEFIKWVESKGWFFGGGFNEIIDGYYILPNGEKGKPVSEK